MNMEKRRGPRTEPWGTPDVMVRLLERSSSMTVQCCLQHRYELNHWQAVEPYPSSLRRDSRMSWLTESNALEMSRKTAPTKRPLSSAW